MAHPEPRCKISATVSAAIAPVPPQSLFAGWLTFAPPADNRMRSRQRHALGALARQIADASGAPYALVRADLATMPDEWAPMLNSAEGWSKLAAFVGAPGAIPSAAVN